MDIKSSKVKNGLTGAFEIPSDKSISHRAVMFSSIAKGKSLIKNFLYAADCRSTVGLFKSLGVEINFVDNNTLEVRSDGRLKATNLPLDCGNSGTTMRLVSGILSGQNFNSTLIGDESLSKRPMKRIIDPLMLMGADIFSKDNKAPLQITGKQLEGIEYSSPIASAQVKSSILLAGLRANGTTKVIEPYVSRNHSEIMLEYMGANISTEGYSVSIEKSELEAKDIVIAGDISSAAFFIVAGLIVPNSDITIKNVGLNPTRTGIIDVVLRMGADIEILDKRIISGEEVGDLRVKYSSNLKSCNINGADIPRLIDELPIIALLATQAEGVTKITDAQDLRNKEADRITAVATEFKKIGLQIEELQDGFIIEGRQQVLGNTDVEVYHDHRLAMTLYIAGLIANKEILVKEFQWVDISMPEFLSIIEDLKK